MRRNKKVVYTVRDVPETTDARVREVAEAEDVSLNTAVIRVMERGLGGETERIRRRDLRSDREALSAADERGWRAFLADADVVDPAAWK